MAFNTNTYNLCLWFMRVCLYTQAKGFPFIRRLGAHGEVDKFDEVLVVLVLGDDAGGDEVLEVLLLHVELELLDADVLGVAVLKVVGPQRLQQNFK